MDKIRAFIGSSLLFAFFLVAPIFASNELQAEVSPKWVNTLSETDYVLDFENLAASADAVNEIRIPKPANNATKITCGSAPAGWDLASPFGTAICAYATSESPIQPGGLERIPLKISFAELPLNITILAKDNGTDNVQTRFVLGISFDNTTPAEIKISSPAPDSWERQGLGIYFDATADDADSGISSCTVSLGSTFLGSLNYSKEDGKCKGIVYLPERVPEGKQVIVVSERDAAGNEKTHLVQITVDNTPPKIKRVEIRDIGGLVSGFVRPGTGFEIVAQIEDGGSGFSESTVEADISKLVGVDGAISIKPEKCDVSSCKWTGTVASAAQDGEILSFVVFASDKAGSGIALSDSVARVDSENPLISVSGTVEDISSRSKVPLSFSVTDGSDGSGISTEGIVVELDGAQVEKSCTGGNCLIDIEFSDGKHILKILANDNVGNPATPYSKEFRVDTKGPSISAATVKYRILSSLTGVLIQATISDATTDVKSAQIVSAGKTIELSRNGAIWSGVVVPQADLKLVSEIEIFAEDYAGNRASAKIDEKLFQVVVAGILSHVFGGILLAVFLYWAYSRTLKKRNVTAHFESYKPETFREKLEKFWFDLKRKLKFPRKQHHAEHPHHHDSKPEEKAVGPAESGEELKK
ncbi:MAG: hypothetical protein V1820_05080 [archaeon]